MDHNLGGDWPNGNFAVQDPAWPAAPDGTQNDERRGSVLPLPSAEAHLRPRSPSSQASLLATDASGVANRHAYLFVLGLGLLLTLLAVVISTRVLPRYVDVQRRYGFELPVETTIALRSGMLQPIPGCAVILAGLTGLLARRPSRLHALITTILLLAALGLPMATAAALLVPELTLV